MAEVDVSQTVQSLGGGYFSIDGQTMSFEDVVFDVQMECVQIVDVKFAQKFSEIKDRNKALQDLSDCYQMLNSYTSSFDKDGDAKSGKKGEKISGKLIGFTDKDMKKWKNDTTDPPSGYYYEFVETGIFNDGSTNGNKKGIGNDGHFTKKELDIAIENLKAGQDSKNSENELDMMTLNKLSNQRSTFFQLWSTQLNLIKEARSAAAQR
ncbi:MAG: hypothetical protein V2B13_19270 [Pseudomonadota bacterium]